MLQYTISFSRRITNIYRQFEKTIDKNVLLFRLHKTYLLIKIQNVATTFVLAGPQFRTHFFENSASREDHSTLKSLTAWTYFDIFMVVRNPSSCMRRTIRHVDVTPVSRRGPCPAVRRLAGSSSAAYFYLRRQNDATIINQVNSHSDMTYNM